MARGAWIAYARIVDIGARALGATREQRGDRVAVGHLLHSEVEDRQAKPVLEMRDDANLVVHRHHGDVVAALPETAAELLAMQTTAFRYSQTVEVLSRATDRLVGAIKQTLGTPV